MDLLISRRYEAKVFRFSLKGPLHLVAVVIEFGIPFGDDQDQIAAFLVVHIMVLVDCQDIFVGNGEQDSIAFKVIRSDRSGGIISVVIAGFCAVFPGSLPVRRLQGSPYAPLRASVRLLEPETEIVGSIAGNLDGDCRRAMIGEHFVMRVAFPGCKVEGCRRRSHAFRFAVGGVSRGIDGIVRKVAAQSMVVRLGGALGAGFDIAAGQVDQAESPFKVLE